jgi:hypothetical protein
MIKPIKLIEVKSEIGAGTRGRVWEWMRLKLQP